MNPVIIPAVPTMKTNQYEVFPVASPSTTGHPEVAMTNPINIMAEAIQKTKGAGVPWWPCSSLIPLPPLLT